MYVSPNSVGIRHPLSSNFFIISILIIAVTAPGTTLTFAFSGVVGTVYATLNGTQYSRTGNGNITWSSLSANTSYTTSSVYNISPGQIRSSNATNASGTTLEQFTVTFKDCDGGILSTQVIDSGSDATAPAEPTKTGYTFDSWDTGYTNITADTTVTAVCTANSYTITYKANGGIGSDYTQDFVYDASEALDACTFTYTGYNFDHWNTTAADDGTTYTGGQSVLNLTSTDGGNIDLYAQWDPITYYVAFDANGGTGSLATQTFTYGTPQDLTTNDPETDISRTGYSFNGWNQFSNGTGTSYTNGETVINLTTTDSGTVTLYAQWTIITYTITYSGASANGNDSTFVVTDLPIDLNNPLLSEGSPSTGYYTSASA